MKYFLKYSIGFNWDNLISSAETLNTPVKTLEEAIKDADAAIITTEWPIYKNIKPETYKKLMKKPIIDGRR